MRTREKEYLGPLQEPRRRITLETRQKRVEIQRKEEVKKERKGGKSHSWKEEENEKESAGPGQFLARATRGR